MFCFLNCHWSLTATQVHCGKVPPASLEMEVIHFLGYGKFSLTHKMNYSIYFFFPVCILWTFEMWVVS